MILEWIKSRKKFLAFLKIESREILKARKLRRPYLVEFNCEDQLRTCAEAILSKTKEIQALEDWGQFVRKKIEVFHRFLSHYNAAGKSASEREASIDTYAYAALLLSWMVSRSINSSERLQWLNALLKCLDISVHQGPLRFKGLASRCLGLAIDEEISCVRKEIKNLGIKLIL